MVVISDQQCCVCLQAGGEVLNLLASSYRWLKEPRFVDAV